MLKDECDFRTTVRDYLQSHHVATLATCSQDIPWAAAVFYVFADETIYFLSSPKSRHALNLAQNSRVALTVQENLEDWLRIKGIQIEGVASEISGAEEEKARRIYGKRFPLLGMASGASAHIVKALAKVHWYKVVPEQIYFIDNSLGLGSRTVITINNEQ